MALPESITQRILSPQAQELVKKIKEKYTAEGKAGAAENYPGLIGKFFKWAEASGHAINTLPEDAVEAFLDAYNPEKLSSKDVMRQQIKSITNKISAEFGINMNHLVFKKNEAPKLSAAEKRARKAAKEAAKVGQLVPNVQVAETPAENEFYDPEPVAQEDENMAEELSVSTAAAPAFEAFGPGGVPQMPQSAGISPQVLVVQAPAPEAPAAAKGNGKANNNSNAVKPAQVPTHFIVNGIAFRGPYTRISRVADGLEPGVMPGSETILFVVPTANIVKAGDPAQFLQHFVVPQLRFPPTATQVTFVLEELTAKREPTAVRAEISVGLTNNMPVSGLGGFPMPAAPAPAQYAPPPPAPTPQNDRTLDFLLKRMESDIENARKREQELQEKMAKESNVQMQMMLMQMQEKAAAERRVLEERMFEEQRRSRMMEFPPPPSGFGPMGPGFGPPSFGPSSVPTLPLDPLPSPLSPPSQVDMLKPVVEQLGGLTTTLINATLNKPQAPQKDSMEVMLPFISAMNQQMMQQQQQNQAMLVQIQQANQQMMHALLTKPPQESATEKFLAQQLQYMERRLEQKENSSGEFERMLTMVLKLKQVAPEILGGGEQRGGLLEMLIENSDSLLGGAAQLMQAMQGGGQPQIPVIQPKGAMAGAPQPRPLPQRQTPPPQDDAQPVNRQPKAAPAPQEVVVQATPAPEATNGSGEQKPAEPNMKPVTEAVERMGEIAKKDEVDGDELIPAFQNYFGTLGSVSEQHQNLASQILTAFEQVESYEDVYEITKAIRATGNLPARNQETKDIAKALHMFYSEIYAAFFDGKQKKLADADEEAAA